MSEHDQFVRKMQGAVEEMRAAGVEPFRQDASAAQEQGCQMPHYDEAAHDVASKTAGDGKAVIAPPFLAKLERARRQIESAARTLGILESQIKHERLTWQEQRHQEQQEDGHQPTTPSISPYVAPLLILAQQDLHRAILDFISQGGTLDLAARMVDKIRSTQPPT